MGKCFALTIDILDPEAAMERIGQDHQAAQGEAARRLAATLVWSLRANEVSEAISPWARGLLKIGSGWSGHCEGEDRSNLILGAEIAQDW